MTLRNIIGELKRAENKRSNSCHIPDRIGLARRVLERRDFPKGQTDRRSIFAILCLMDISLRIVDFVSSDIFDGHMPFAFSTPGRACRRDENVLPTFLEQWAFKHRDMFKMYQGSFLVPYFRFSTGATSHIPRLELHPSTALPFLEDEAASQIVEVSNYSTVRKVQIHDAHHDCKHTSPYFAIKQLRTEASESSIHESIHPEVEAYRRLNPIEHQHIVRLLATYTKDNNLYIMFPWADSNLFDFWCKHFPEVHQLPRGAGLARWVAKQMLGLAEALKNIHNLQIGEHEVQTLSPTARQQTHGRHGDIKPENVLWFKESETSGVDDFLNSTLKISDLGSADFHSLGSRSVGLSTTHGGFTATYKAPEFDMRARVSPLYDIWSFGCVLMQFVIWYLDGRAGVERFGNLRTAESHQRIRTDEFFNFYQTAGGSRLTSKAKPSVREEIDRLREHPDGSDFVLDVLDLIQSDLLRMDYKKRAGCDQIVKDFDKISQRCERDPAYCTARAPRVMRKTRTDLSDSVVVELSKETEEEVKAGFPPQGSSGFETPTSSEPKAPLLSSGVTQPPEVPKPIQTTQTSPGLGQKQPKSPPLYADMKGIDGDTGSSTSTHRVPRRRDQLVKLFSMFTSCARAS
ncbi:kinase-like domain-containing protein [Boeremia exigua]|uniref:kinase-like domain-containing protein n=1 Tax=Boeremia exigua TaxID=749465 RepID=UPI001E8E58A6|nr:kinase-like domain-containing protein [Boeremia exigua]KAH6625486.1 kinase-like domain-containing protein [Boeremia exigua]